MFKRRQVRRCLLGVCRGELKTAHLQYVASPAGFNGLFCTYQDQNACADGHPGPASMPKRIRLRDTIFVSAASTDGHESRMVTHPPGHWLPSWGQIRLCCAGRVFVTWRAPKQLPSDESNHDLEGATPTCFRISRNDVVGHGGGGDQVCEASCSRYRKARYTTMQ